MTTGDTDGKRRHALVAGGGTGGHVFPGIALATELGRRRWKVSFAGLSGGFEERLATEAGLPFHGLEARPVVGVSALRKVHSLLTTLRASAAGRQLVDRERIDAVVGLGGYASVPAVLGGRFAGRPILLFEANAAPGVANRWLSRIASEAAIAYESAARSLRCRTTVTGTPVRAEFFNQPVEPPQPAAILVLGGSQGARQLNQMVPRALAELGAQVGHFEVLHQCGPDHVESTEADYRVSAPVLAGLEVVPFLDDVAAALGRASLVVSRAGASTLAEICAVGRPSVLVPLALAAAHQADNAKDLVETGAAELLPSGGQAGDLARILTSLLEPHRLAEMSLAARRLGRADAVERLADRLIDLAEGA